MRLYSNLKKINNTKELEFLVVSVEQYSHAISVVPFTN